MKCFRKNHPCTEPAPCPNHRLIQAETYSDCTVRILTCPDCGAVETMWWRNDHPPVQVLNTQEPRSPSVP
ncbi:MAG: hypothetical protein RSD95_03985 [Clostridia bacterium]